jgi:signal transduction histidine kinase
LRDLPRLLQEITRGAQRLARARRVEIHLPERPGRTGQHPESHPVLPGPGTGAAGERRVSERRIVLPIRSGEHTLATLRLHAPRGVRLDPLRGYLLHAGAALARALEQEQMQRRAGRYEALLDSVPDACLLVIAPDDLVVELRGQADTPLAQLAASAIARPLETALVGEHRLELSRPQVRRLLRVARRSGHAETSTHVRAGERQVDVQMTLVRAGESGDLLCILRDTSAVNEMERALLRRNEELQLAAERLKEVDMLKNEFMSNVSHELRTPLTAIIAYTEAMLRTPPDAKTRDNFLRVIAEQGEKLQRLIAGLLDIAKLDSLATELKLQLGAINDIIEAAVVTVRPTADKKHIHIALELEADLPPVYLDELRSQQIVWNLLTNGIKFSPPGSTITVRSWSRDGQVWTAVSDQGIGIAPEHHQLIFEKFVQVDGSTTRRHGGVGLGLDLVKHLVELHGGTVAVESVLGQGATFRFSIPVEKRRRQRFGAPSPLLDRTARKR